MISQWKSLGFEQIKCPSTVVSEGEFGPSFVPFPFVVSTGSPVEPPEDEPPLQVPPPLVTSSGFVGFGFTGECPPVLVQVPPPLWILVSLCWFPPGFELVVEDPCPFGLLEVDVLQLPPPELEEASFPLFFLTFFQNKFYTSINNPNPHY